MPVAGRPHEEHCFSADSEAVAHSTCLPLAIKQGHPAHSREADRFRDSLTDLYGEERAKTVKYAEAFELCEYGRKPTAAELKQLFPFFEK